MKKILLMDTLSTIHVGNGALLENTIKLCRDAFGECEFHIITMDRETNALKYDPSKLYKPIFGDFWFGKSLGGKLIWAVKNVMFVCLHIINEQIFHMRSTRLTFTPQQKSAIGAIEEVDICVSCGGEIIGDTFFQALPFWLFSYWLAIKKGKKFILFPQSVGPLRMTWTRFLVRQALKRADLLVGRDEPSYKTLLSLGMNPSNVMFVPDVAIQQDAGDANVHQYFADEQKKVVGVTISNPPHREKGKPVDFVSILRDQLSCLNPEEYKILILPSNYVRNGISKDYALCSHLKDRLALNYEVGILENRAYFPGEYTALLQQLDAFISTRMHVAILATTVFTPTIAINTQHKILGYMNNIHMGRYCIEYEQLDHMNTLLREVLDNQQTISDQLMKENQTLKKKHGVFVERMKGLFS